MPDHYRPLVARWIKWSLMINRLREIIAKETPVGVIGLMNSGKSKFVRSIFGIKVVGPPLAPMAAAHLQDMLTIKNI